MDLMKRMAGSPPAAKDSITIDVGFRLKMLREERLISMRALARRSGLSANALSMIERGLTSPSVGTLTKLSRALEVPITAFFRMEAPRQPVVHYKGEASPLASGTVWEALGGDDFSGRLEPYLHTAAPNASSGPRPMFHTGQELIYILNGRLEYTVGGREYLLEEGDALLLFASLPHRWRNPGPGEARTLVTFAGFEEGERPGEFHRLDAVDPVGGFDAPGSDQASGE